MDKTTHQIRCEQWTGIIQNWMTSGMSKTAWCQENDISIKSFYYWQRILRNEAFIDQKLLPAVSEPHPPVALVELQPVSKNLTQYSDFHPDVIIKSANMTIEISNSVSPELLSQLGGLFHA